MNAWTLYPESEVCTSLPAALWEGHGVEVRTYRADKPGPVPCSGCGRTLRRKIVTLIGCTTCSVPVAFGDHWCRECAR